MISQDYFFFFFFLPLRVSWTNEPPPPPHALKRSLFTTFLCSLIFVILYFVELLFFRTPTALICNSANFMGSSLHSCVFSILTFFFFVRVHCVRLSPLVYLCSLPPPLSLRLSSVITALDSSSDGKCFSIPLSPAFPPRRISIFLLFSPSKLCLGYYRDMFIECFSAAPSYFLPSPSLPLFFLSPTCVYSFLTPLWTDGHLHLFPPNLISLFCCLRSHFFFGD